MTSPGSSALSDERPFPGLRPFSPLDREYFFGRRSQFYALYRLLHLSRFVAVIGNSGSGKSSLVRAGLLPLLDEESGEAAGRKWLWAEMRPGDRPLESLTKLLTRLGDRLASADDAIIASARAERIAHHLRGSSHGISKAVGDMDGAEGWPILLVIDQFEELFRFAASGLADPSLKEEARLRDEATHFVQLILEASRTPAARIHVLLTMRSDFIGDCARFQGLPEAVSATQFLVPSLTRDQREEVITGPIALAGGTIEPSLVERLLNDSSDELDQLPVLQHCLLRLWERAGATDRFDSGKSDGRRITLREYDEIQGMAGALSQHAEEILTKDLQGLEPLVAQAFRALSNLDRDGRATRRALSFQQLGAETAIEEGSLRTLLDRFRADDCSFLAPSPGTTAVLEPRTRIDVGHEALLRRWTRLSGVPGATGERGDTRAIGWMKEEHRDGQRYQALLAMTGGDDSERAVLPAEQIPRYWNWWNERPRTEAWAERYGGGYARVVKLLEDSRAAYDEQQHYRRAEEKNKLWAQRTRAAARVLAVLLFFGAVAGYVLWGKYQAQYKLAQEQAESKLKLTQALVNLIESTRFSGAMTAGAAKDLLGQAATTLAEIPDSSLSATFTRAQLLIAFSDASKVFGEADKAFSQAQEANALAKKLVEADPSQEEWQRLVFASAYRVGEAKLSFQSPPEEIQSALNRYDEALTVAEKLNAAAPRRGDWLFDLAFIHNKIGEAMQVRKDYASALPRFRIALGFAQQAAAADRENIMWQGYLASTFVKIAFALARKQPADYDGALAHCETAIAMHQESFRRFPNNNVVISNVAGSRRARADILVERWMSGDLEKAVKDYHAANSLLASLVERDPSDLRWQVALVPGYARLARAFEKAGQAARAYPYAQKELEIWYRLVRKDETNKQWRDSFARANARLARLIGLRGR